MVDPDNSLTPSPATTVDLTGRELGDYVLMRRLGRGGMADVYLAKQTSLQRHVALKILKPELARDTSYVKRFEREAQAAAALVQANIVQIYEVGHREGYYFIAQEYVRGRNLKQYLDRHGAVEAVMAINILRQSAMALQKADELEVIHRDIKPENIMLSTSGEVKVTDFGLARINRDAGQQALTQIGITMGTPLYMSPEQVGGQDIDCRSDIYSLGVTAYHMLAGEPPFNADTPLAIAVRHLNDQAKPLGEIRPDLPTELVTIIDKMMAKKPRDRQADARSLLKELRKVKIDADADWEMIIEKLAVSELADGGSRSTSLSQANLAATRQLQQVMRGHKRTWYGSTKFWMSVLMASMLGLIAGGWFAIKTKPESLLNVETLASQTIPREDTIEKQYNLARWRLPDEREAFYKAVLDYFPLKPDESNSNKNELYRRHAKARLAEQYLTQERWAEARLIFEEFINFGDMSEDLRIMGHAGLAYLYFKMDDESFGGQLEREREMTIAMQEVRDSVDLLNEFMRQRFEEVSASRKPDPLPPVIDQDN